MVSLPVWELGLIIALPLAGALAVRPALNRQLILPAPAESRSTRQFRMDLLLYIVASLVMGLAMYLVHGFSFLHSGIRLVLGIVTIGLFASLDMALEREKENIVEARLTGGRRLPPERLLPMTRRFSLAATLVIVLITIIMLLLVHRDLAWLGNQAYLVTADGSGRSILFEITFVMAFLLTMTINLILSYSSNLKLLLENQTQVLERVSKGDLSKTVPVATEDELGHIAGHTNSMINGLRESDRLRRGVEIAREVQLNFLPETAPDLPGVKLAGTSLFSDETGGDFFDYVECEADSCSRIAVVVGDVVGHGLGAALLMASARAMIRQGLTDSSPLGERMNRINASLSRDLDGTGRFLSLFVLELDLVHSRATWVNAGHPPTLLFNPKNDTITELKSGDIPFGVAEDWNFTEQSMDYPSDGQVLIMSTDGIAEAFSATGEMFGNERFKDLVRESSNESAETILQTILERIKAHQGNMKPDDDTTLVVLKADD